MERFTGPRWQQEDDVTLVTLQRTPLPETKVLAEFTVRSEPGNEREAIRRVTDAVQPLGLSAARLERLQTAVGEATMNAMEHGNQNRSDCPVAISVDLAGDCVRVRITDQGHGSSALQQSAPDLEAKLSGVQTPRGWGLLLIEKMVGRDARPDWRWLPQC